MSENRKTSQSDRKRRKGMVISRSGNKSVVVLVQRHYSHPTYGKVLRVAKKFHVHDEKNEAKVGDKVLISECRPMSRMKRWMLVSVLEKSGSKSDKEE